MPDDVTPIASLAEARAKRRRKAPITPGDPNLPLIRLTAGELPRVVDEAEAALLKAALGIFQRGSVIVRPVKAKVAIADGGETFAYRVAEVSVSHLAECFTRAARWEKWDSRAQDYVPADCPSRIAETYIARAGKWDLPLLTGVIGAPTLRPDGSLLDRPGYDPRTGLFFEPDGAAFPPIAREPTVEDARRALAVLLEPLATFPFIDRVDRSVALSAILTTLIRRSLPATPLHGFTAPVAGSGKTMLVDIASLIATGRPASVIAQGKTEEELEKRLGAALLAGDQVIAIDNCEQPLGGDLLCQALTQGALKIRVLGQSANVDVPSNAAISATGNNLVLAGDLTRRAVLCSLDPACERPELRQFDRDPLLMVREARGSLVVAALTVLRAFHVAGRPEQAPPMGGFTEWSRLVRDALLWLGEADPCSTMEKTRAADPRLAILVTILEQWEAVIGERRVPLKEVIEQAVSREQSWDGGAGRFLFSDFRDAILAVAGDGGMVNSRRLGKWLAAHQGRFANGRRIVQDGGRAGVAYWRLEVTRAQ